MLAAATLVAMAWGTDASAISCEGGSAVQPLPVRTTPVPPLYSGLLGRPAALAAPRALLAESRDESLALDVVLTRLRLEACANAPVDEFANYVPKTAHDNTPYRFNMTQGGKRMTADDFDAWLQANGYNVGSRRVDPNAAPAPAVEAAAPGQATPVE